MTPGRQPGAPARATSPLTGGRSFVLPVLVLAITGALLFWAGVRWGRPFAPARSRATPVVARPVALPPMVGADAGSGAGATPATPSVRDWADSALVPSWVLHDSTPPRPTTIAGLPPPVTDSPTDGPADGFGKTYVQLGTGGRPVTAGIAPPPVSGTGDIGRPRSPMMAPADPASDPVGPLPGERSARGGVAVLLPRVAYRAADGQAWLLDPGIGGHVGANPSTSTRWTVVSGCRAALTLSDVPTGARVRGTMAGAVSASWRFALVVPDAECRSASGRSVMARSPLPSDRRMLAALTSTSAIVTGLGAPAFREEELEDFATETIQGTTIAWGVFRGRARTTQVSPPPELPALAFVARVVTTGAWELLWAKYQTSTTDVLGLAGVYAVGSGEGVTAFFGVASGDGTGRLLAVGADAHGLWGLRATAPLPAP